MLKTLAKTVVVIVSSTLLTTLTTHAFDIGGGIPRSLLGSVFGLVNNTPMNDCPDGMTLVTQTLTPFCIDLYELAAANSCPFTDPHNADETALNLASEQCHPVSHSHIVPWRNITQNQAQEACARVGKRLPNAGEWYSAALGTPDPEMDLSEDLCNVAHNRNDGVSTTGSGMRCVSDVGAYDMIGNVWEWVAETVDHGIWHERTLPTTGFVSGVDIDGVPYASDTARNTLFSSDRVWTDKTTFTGMMRGGYYNSGAQAGVYALYAASEPIFAGEATGFRCVTAPNSNK